MKRIQIAVLLAATNGCSGRYMSVGMPLVNLGDGDVQIRVPRAAVSQYAKSHSITRDEAMARMKTEIDASQIEE